jgi:3-deoxy-D-manno-octulosonate 8-phosphate phosphatase (KDO 8-P phosphatase)
LPDIALLEVCGLAVTVPHAPAAVRARAHYVTAREGGSGAVRELADLILAAQGRDGENRLAHLPPVALARKAR